MKTVLKMLKEDTVIQNTYIPLLILKGCYCAGIRLSDEGDPGNFPFYCSDGFTQEFLRTENSLVRCKDGKRILAQGFCTHFCLKD